MALDSVPALFMDDAQYLLQGGQALGGLTHAVLDHGHHSVSDRRILYLSRVRAVHYQFSYFVVRFQNLPHADASLIAGMVAVRAAFAFVEFTAGQFRQYFL